LKIMKNSVKIVKIFWKNNIKQPTVSQTQLI